MLGMYHFVAFIEVGRQQVNAIHALFGVSLDTVRFAQPRRHAVAHPPDGTLKMGADQAETH